MKKVCIRCGIKKELSIIYFFKKKTGGWINTCRKCKNQYSTMYRVKHLEIAKQVDSMEYIPPPQIIRYTWETKEDRKTSIDQLHDYMNVLTFEDVKNEL